MQSIGGNESGASAARIEWPNGRETDPDAHVAHLSVGTSDHRDAEARIN